MSAGAGFGSDGGDVAMARATGESPRGRIHIPIHRGIDAREEKGRNIWTDDALNTGLQDQTEEAYFIHSGAQREGGWEAVIDSGFKTLPTGRKSTRKKGKVFSITGDGRVPPLDRSPRRRRPRRIKAESE